MRSRDRLVKVYLNDMEYANLKEKATGCHVTVSVFLRKLIAEEKLKTFPPDAVRDLRKQVRGIGRNINQMARHANTCGTISSFEIQQLFTNLQNIQDMISELR